MNKYKRALLWRTPQRALFVNVSLFVCSVCVLALQCSVRRTLDQIVCFVVHVRPVLTVHAVVVRGNQSSATAAFFDTRTTASVTFRKSLQLPAFGAVVGC